MRPTRLPWPASWAMSQAAITEAAQNAEAAREGLYDQNGLVIERILLSVPGRRPAAGVIALDKK